MVKVTFPDGTQAEMIDVEIKAEMAPWNTFKLEDGTELKIRINVTKIQRAKDKFNQAGDPLYSVMMGPITVRVRVPPKLKAREAKRKDAPSVSEVG